MQYPNSPEYLRAGNCRKSQTNKIDVPKAPIAAQKVAGRGCGKLVLSSARPFSSWRWWYSRRPPVPSPTRCAPCFACSVAAAHQWSPRSYCVQSINNLPRKASPVLVAKGSTTPSPPRRRSVSTPLSLPNRVFSLGRRHLSAFRDGADLPPHIYTASRPGRGYSVVRIL